MLLDPVYSCLPAPASDHAPSPRVQGQADFAIPNRRMIERRRPLAHASPVAACSPAGRRNPARMRAARLGLVVAALSLLPGMAPAHAIIVRAQPAMNSVVPAGDIMIRIEFNSRIDRERSGLVLKRPDGTEEGVALTPESAPGVLAGRAQVQQNGTWKLHWQVLSLDGHITRGEVDFSVRDAAETH